MGGLGYSFASCSAILVALGWSFARLASIWGDGEARAVARFFCAGCRGVVATVVIDRLFPMPVCEEILSIALLDSKFILPRKYPK